MNSEVYLLDSEKNQRELIADNSTKRGIVFASMKECDTLYYKELISDFKTIKTICFVTNHQNIDLHTLLN